MELQEIQNKIHEIRGQRIMLDFDLSEMYEVEARALKQAVRRIQFFNITNCDLKKKRYKC